MIEKITNWEKCVTLKRAEKFRGDICSLDKEDKKDVEWFNELSNKNKHYEHEKVTKRKVLKQCRKNQFGKFI